MSLQTRPLGVFISPGDTDLCPTPTPIYPHSRQPSWLHHSHPADWVPHTDLSNSILEETRAAPWNIPQQCIAGCCLDDECLILSAAGPAREFVSLLQISTSLTKSGLLNQAANTQKTYQPSLFPLKHSAHQLKLNNSPPPHWDTFSERDIYQPILAVRGLTSVTCIPLEKKEFHKQQPRRKRQKAARNEITANNDAETAEDELTNTTTWDFAQHSSSQTHCRFSQPSVDMAWNPLHNDRLVVLHDDCSVSELALDASKTATRTCVPIWSPRSTSSMLGLTPKNGQLNTNNFSTSVDDHQRNNTEENSRNEFVFSDASSLSSRHMYGYGTKPVFAFAPGHPRRIFTACSSRLWSVDLNSSFSGGSSTTTTNSSFKRRSSGGGEDLFLELDPRETFTAVHAPRWVLTRHGSAGTPNLFHQANNSTSTSFRTSSTLDAAGSAGLSELNTYYIAAATTHRVLLLDVRMPKNIVKYWDHSRLGMRPPTLDDCFILNDDGDDIGRQPEVADRRDNVAGPSSSRPSQQQRKGILKNSTQQQREEQKQGGKEEASFQNKNSFMAVDTWSGRGILCEWQDTSKIAALAVLKPESNTQQAGSSRRQTSQSSSLNGIAPKFEKLTMDEYQASSQRCLSHQNHPILNHTKEKKKDKNQSRATKSSSIDTNSSSSTSSSSSSEDDDSADDQQQQKLKNPGAVAATDTNKEDDDSVIFAWEAACETNIQPTQPPYLVLCPEIEQKTAYIIETAKQAHWQQHEKKSAGGGVDVECIKEKDPGPELMGCCVLGHQWSDGRGLKKPVIARLLRSGDVLLSYLVESPINDYRNSASEEVEQTWDCCILPSTQQRRQDKKEIQPTTTTANGALIKNDVDILKERELGMKAPSALPVQKGATVDLHLHKALLSILATNYRTQSRLLNTPTDAASFEDNQPSTSTAAVNNINNTATASVVQFTEEMRQLLIRVLAKATAPLTAYEVFTAMQIVRTLDSMDVDDGSSTDSSSLSCSSESDEDMASTHDDDDDKDDDDTAAMKDINNNKAKLMKQAEKRRKTRQRDDARLVKVAQQRLSKFFPTRQELEKRLQLLLTAAIPEQKRSTRKAESREQHDVQPGKLLHAHLKAFGVQLSSSGKINRHSLNNALTSPQQQQNQTTSENPVEQSIFVDISELERGVIPSAAFQRALLALQNHPVYIENSDVFWVIRPTGSMLSGVNLAFAAQSTHQNRSNPDEGARSGVGDAFNIDLRPGKLKQQVLGGGVVLWPLRRSHDENTDIDQQQNGIQDEEDVHVLVRVKSPPPMSSKARERMQNLKKLWPSEHDSSIMCSR